MIKLVKTILLTGLLSSPSFGSYALVLLEDNFDAENGGASALNYGSFANWQVRRGTVDLVRSGDYGVFGAGSFVDLDGSTFDAGRIVSSVFSFDAGTLYRLTFDLAGDGRNDGLNRARSIVTTIDGPDGEPNYLNELISLQSNAAWQTYQYDFYGQDINGRIVFRGDVGNNINDNIGLLLDNVKLESISVNEPGTLGLIALGLIGLAASRRRQA